MFIEFFFVLLVLYHFYWYGVPYAIGSAQYARLNNNGTSESEDSWASVLEEYGELVKAVHLLSPHNIFLEFFDMLHAWIKFLIVCYLPKFFYFRWICWIIVFPLVLPASVKLARRYNKFMCIRNHGRPNLNHKCVLNKYSIVKQKK